MSKNRSEVLPGAAVWDSFYDKRVQFILETRRCVPALDLIISEEARCEFLAWPIIAYCAVDDLVQDRRTKIRRQVGFLDAYAEEPTFVSSLLAELTMFHFPKNGKPLARKVAEASNQCRCEDVRAWLNSGGTESGRDRLSLHDWKTVAEILGCRNSPDQLKTEFHREKRRRESIRRKWDQNFRAWKELQATQIGGAALLPLQRISLRE